MNLARSFFNKKSILIFFVVLIFLLFINKDPLHVANTVEAALNAPVVHSLTTTSVNFTAKTSRGTSETYPLDKGKPIFHFSVSGDITLNSEASLTRIVLTDIHKREYLVYEAYPLTVDSSSFSISNACEETCVLYSVIPASLRLEVDNSSIRINNFSFTNDFDQLSTEVKKIGLASARTELKTKKGNTKIEKINRQIKAKSMLWVAGETSISKMTYAEKKTLFGLLDKDGKPRKNLPDLQGFEYYKGGVFEIKSDSEKKVLAAATSTSDKKVLQAATANYPVSWDWRNRHGANWVTSVKCQALCYKNGQYICGPRATGGDYVCPDDSWQLRACGSCWAFGATAATELLVNLYFNKPWNLDLSEQQLVSCCNSCFSTSGCRGGWMMQTLLYYQNYGVVDEECFPYRGIDSQGCDASSCNFASVPCSQICSSYHDKIKIGGRKSFTHPKTEDKLKRMIIEHGAVYAAVVDGLNHSMQFIGYKVVEAGDVLGEVIIEPGDPLIGRTYWIFKNSWGADWGEDGFGKILLDINLVDEAYALLPPVTHTQSGEIDPDLGVIQCVDMDNDGYCNWGISSSKPSTCPASCDQERDCDDSDPNLGPFDDNFNCISILIPTLTPTLTPTLAPTSTPALTPTPTPTPTPASSANCFRKPQGDANCDGSIDGVDYSMWLNSQCRSSPTQGCGSTRADFNHDGNVDDEDHLIWLDNRRT